MRFSLYAEIKTSISIKELFPGLKASETLLQTVVAIQKLQPMEIDSQFPANLNVHQLQCRLFSDHSNVLEWWNGVYVLKNFTNGDAVDIFILVQTTTGWLMFCIQCKWREATTTKEMEVTKEVLSGGRDKIKQLFKTAIAQLGKKMDSVSKVHH